MESKYNKILLSGSVVLFFAVYAVLAHRDGDSLSIPQANQNIQQSSSITQNTATVTLNSLYKDGEYIGSVEDAIFGDMQVKATINSGKISAVEFVKYPDDKKYSIEINQNALKQLQSEVIRVQDSNVDIVTGATESSVAFNKSLATALVKAKN